MKSIITKITMILLHIILALTEILSPMLAYLGGIFYLYHEYHILLITSLLFIANGAILMALAIYLDNRNTLLNKD